MKTKKKTRTMVFNPSERVNTKYRCSYRNIECEYANSHGCCSRPDIALQMCYDD